MDPYVLYRHGAQRPDLEAVELGEHLLGRVRGSLRGRLVTLLLRPLLVGRRAAALDVLRPLAVQELDAFLTGMFKRALYYLTLELI